MIRRNGQKRFLLISQNEHAAISAHIASHWGNDVFPAPKPRDAVIEAIASHNAGWSLEDDSPILNADHAPASFYELPHQCYIRVWVASVSAASAKGGPMAGLVVSWHFTDLARRVSKENLDEAVRLHLEDFVSAQRVRQTDYCKTLCLSPSMADDPPVPLTEKDLQALYNYYLLRVCDWISLQLCDDSIRDRSVEYACAPQWNGNEPIQLSWADKKTLCLTPWPLEVSSLLIRIKALSVPSGKYRRETDLLRVYEQAGRKTLSYSLSEPV
ncbi:MAG: DUF3891 family protein [Planctomycetota bacterium]|jgi:hypothetical protein